MSKNASDKIVSIKNILLRYFEVDDNGNASSKFDSDYTAQQCVDDIHDIVGEI